MNNINHETGIELKIKICDTHLNLEGQMKNTVNSFWSKKLFKRLCDDTVNLYPVDDGVGIGHKMRVKTYKIITDLDMDITNIKDFNESQKILFKNGNTVLHAFLFLYFIPHMSILEYHIKCCQMMNLCLPQTSIENLYMINNFFIKEMAYLSMLKIDPRFISEWKDTVNNNFIYFNKRFEFYKNQGNQKQINCNNNDDENNNNNNNKRIKKEEEEKKNNGWLISFLVKELSVFQTINLPSYFGDERYIRKIREFAEFIIVHCNFILDQKECVYYKCCKFYTFVTEINENITPASLIGFRIYISFFTLTHLALIHEEIKSMISTKQSNCLIEFYSE